ncbi:MULTISPECIES: U32 family peptidase [unclassified Leptolyngbya]|uniref:U32 family peptidase n=1 Tax=unclassified Leptolyngbya TaxID=2650499 RepID=UPI001687A29C|nr:MULTISPECIES: U32 family peptidase [unclassified Leptolyngbya]MBD1913489.1 U32 family peptidase [Leptolyngbya sp. FACHB-8]MBD2154885.1 U32 family peptidase [Leptolyngbya sp. FACHB-16]
MAKPELLAPAKNLERLKVVITYGADAVYVGGERYGLRARADNFTLADLAQGVAFAHRHSAKVYVALNAFLHDSDLAGLGDYCRDLQALGVDAVIVSDLGVIREIQQATSLAIHLSTQASCLNSGAANVWRRAGVQRLIVGRELSIAEAGAIQRQTGLEVEMFTHGAMCMAYSGHCTISNFTAGRDSNRGGCIQSCRLPYFVGESASPAPIPFMSSRDLWGIDQIGAFVEHGICSLKIEGRMKSSFYGAIASRVYRRLIDAHANGLLDAALLDWAAAELRSVPHRDYFTGSLATPAGPDSVFSQAAGINIGTHQYLGMVMETTGDAIVVHLVEPLALDDEIEIVPPQGDPVRWRVSQMQSVIGEPQSRARQESIVRFPKDKIPGGGVAIAPFQVIRQAIPAEARTEVGAIA